MGKQIYVRTQEKGIIIMEHEIVLYCTRIFMVILVSDFFFFFKSYFDTFDVPCVMQARHTAIF